jgi:hypothetical protein
MEGKMMSKSKTGIAVFISTLLVTAFIMTSFGVTVDVANATDLPQGQPAEDGPRSVTVETIDPNPAMQGIRVPQDEEVRNAISGATPPVSTILFDYYVPGARYEYPEVECEAVPEAVKTSLLAAAAVWSTIVQSLVPINITACWGDAQSDTILSYGYSTKTNLRDFADAPLTNTWYPSVLADALHGSDLNTPGEADIELLVNSGIPWYLGTDANPPADAYDLVTVVIHSLAHQFGINSGIQYIGPGDYSLRNSGSPYVYDTFLQDGAGKKVMAYVARSAELGALMVSNDVWFSGKKANVANSGSRVKVYAPAVWEDQVSLEHLDSDTFTETVNNLMLPGFALGSAQHNVGPIVKGMLQDLGWKVGPVVIPLPVEPKGRVNGYTPIFKWKKVDNATHYQFRVYKGTSTTPVYTRTVTSDACSGLYCQSKPGVALKLDLHKWQVRAKIADVWKPWSATMDFTVAPPLAGFKSTFDENADGWYPLQGDWKVANGTYTTSGIRGEVSSSQRLDVYGIYTYSIKIKSTGCATCGYGMYFNGNIDHVCLSGDWSDGYAFMVDNNGKFQIAMIQNCAFQSLTGWLSYSGITSSWNDLQVTYNKNTGFVQFFINNQRIARGTFKNFTSGVVGLMGYRNTRDYSTVSVTTAELIMSAPASSVLADESALFFDTLTDVFGVEIVEFDERYSE